MAKRGRPPAPDKPVVFYLNLRLYPGFDDALIEYLRSAPPRLRAQYVVRAMESGSVVLSTSALSPHDANDELDFGGVWQ